jgi:hypothetical protein
VTGFGQGDVEIRLPGLSCPLWAVQAQSTGLSKLTLNATLLIRS